MAVFADPGSILSEITLIIFLIVIAGFFAGSETALSSCNRIRLRQLADDGGKAALKACAVIDDFDRAIVVILIATNVCHTLAASIGAMLFISLLGEPGTLISTALITLLVFIFADMVPKSIAKERCDGFMLFCAYPLYIVMKILMPLSAFFTLLSDRFKKAHTDKENREPVYTDDELQDIVETVEEEGVFEPEESDIICSAIEFGDLRVSDIYRPNGKVVSLPADLDEESLKEKLLSVKYSRIPLYRGDKNNYVGFLRSEEYLAALVGGRAKQVKKYVSPARYVAFDAPLATVFESMGKNRCHLMFVRGENKSTVGIITMEDLLECIVGEINDFDDASVSKRRSAE